RRAGVGGDACVSTICFPPFFGTPAPMTPETLAGRLASDASIRSMTEQAWGHVAYIALERESHFEALNELLIAAQELGYSFAEAEITKVADRALEMAFGGGA